MPNKKYFPNRQSIRLKEFDYTQPGAYFITICTVNRECMFGTIANGIVQLNHAGIKIRDCWLWLEQQYPRIKLDEFVIMPDHLHGIISIQNNCMGNSRIAHIKSIGRIIGAFKTVSSKQINQLRQTPGKMVWQRNYWERIIQTENEFNAVRQYIRNNPEKWRL